MGKSDLTLIECNSSLEVIHAHLLRAAHQHDPGDWVIAYPAWVAERLVRPAMWTKVLAVSDTRPEYGNVCHKIRENLRRLEQDISFTSYRRIDLLVSDLSWLMNNVLVARLSRLCSRHGIAFSASILEEGSVLYSGSRLGLRRSLRSWAKYLFLRVNGFPALLITPRNVDYFHPLCQKIFCLHPQFLVPPSRVSMERIDTQLLESVYDGQLVTLQLNSPSCLYLSQPLYKLVGVKRQLSVVRSFKRRLEQEGFSHFFYKPHHADLSSWCALLETECGFKALGFREMVPVEFLAARCNADIILSHSTSALLNLRAYGYQGRVISYGLQELDGSFREQSQFEDYCRALRQVGNVELLDADLI